MLRSAIVLSPLTAVGLTWLAAHRAVPAVAALVVVLAVRCALRPDNHLGVLVVVAVAVEWVAIVSDHTTPWSIGAAAALTVFHASLAAATVAPTTAAWSPAMRRRWTRRAGALVVASGVMWAVVALTGAHRIDAGPVLLTASLLVLAAGALWARTGNISRVPSD